MAFQLLLAAGVVVFALAVLNPFHLLMPTALAMLMLGAFFAFFVALNAFVLRERAVDEREQSHRAQAGRWAFLIGTSVLVVGIMVQDLVAHAIDPWLVWALVAMVVAKLASRAWSDRYC